MECIFRTPFFLPRWVGFPVFSLFALQFNERTVREFTDAEANTLELKVVP
eukprot:NODE_1357_length_620_cov_1.362522_g1071_i0.p1 GENE.NODE_1357_length_620_cov_1.362522_g1071_i0~~NODE_1357_length_620_cov_1.362522_g1071_i0.p1  ORF type:complete len:50 (-),score=4.80 NODE_1357_length_620_cov_1.362522_g1071_i0:342-491(-)